MILSWLNIEEKAGSKMPKRNQPTPILMTTGTKNILEAEYVDTDLGDNHESEHQDCKYSTQRKGRPQSLPRSVVVSVHSLYHGEKGDAHGGGDKDLEGDAKAVEIVLPDQPLKAHQEDALDDQLTKRFCDSF